MNDHSWVWNVTPHEEHKDFPRSYCEECRREKRSDNLRDAMILVSISSVTWFIVLLLYLG